MSSLIPLQHEAICQFPSLYFYNGCLKADQSLKKREIPGRSMEQFWPKGERLPIVFCNVVGWEGGLSGVDTDKEKIDPHSKCNKQEAGKVVSIDHQVYNILCSDGFHWWLHLHTLMSVVINTFIEHYYAFHNLICHLCILSTAVVNLWTILGNFLISDASCYCTAWTAWCGLQGNGSDHPLLCPEEPNPQVKEWKVCRGYRGSAVGSASRHSLDAKLKKLTVVSITKSR